METDQQGLRRSKRAKRTQSTGTQGPRDSRRASKRGKNVAQRVNIFEFMLELPLDVLLEVCRQSLITFLSLVALNSGAK